MAFNLKATQDLQYRIDTMGENSSSQSMKQIKAHIDAGADPTIQQRTNGNSILMLAILWSDSPNNEHIEYLLNVYAKYPAVLDYKDNLEGAGNTALMLAIKKGFYSLAIQLLKKGANPNIASDTDGLCPLHIACALLGTATTGGADGTVNYEKEKELIDLIHELIQHKADINQPNAFGTLPLEFLDAKKFTQDDTLYYEKPKPPLGVFLGYPPAFVLAYEKKYLQNFPYGSWMSPIMKPIYEVPEEFGPIHGHYLSYYNDMRVRISEKKTGNEVNEILDKWPEKYKSFYRMPDFEHVSLHNIFDRAKTDSTFQHLTTKEAVEQECQKQNGVLEKPFRGLDIGHAEGKNDLMSVVSSVCWHRGYGEKQINMESFLKPRQLFYSTEFGQSNVIEIRQLAASVNSDAVISAGRKKDKTVHTTPQQAQPAGWGKEEVVETNHGSIGAKKLQPDAHPSVKPPIVQISEAHTQQNILNNQLRNEHAENYYNFITKLAECVVKYRNDADERWFYTLSNTRKLSYQKLFEQLNMNQLLKDIQLKTISDTVDYKKILEDAIALVKGHIEATLLDHTTKSRLSFFTTPDLVRAYRRALAVLSPDLVKNVDPIEINSETFEIVGTEIAQDVQVIYNPIC